MSLGGARQGVKAETGDPEPQRRVRAEAEVIGCSYAILASGAAEARQLQRLYGADPARIEIVHPGVDHAFFSPGPRQGARAALAGLGVGDGPVLLFVGRTGGVAVLRTRHLAAHAWRSIAGIAAMATATKTVEKVRRIIKN